MLALGRDLALSCYLLIIFCVLSLGLGRGDTEVRVVLSIQALNVLPSSSVPNNNREGGRRERERKTQ